MEEKKDKFLLKNMLIFLGFVLLASGNVFIQNLANLDEIWIYNFGRCIADGLLPYKDISMVITPLFPMICGLLIKIFGNELIVLRFAECIEVGTILFMMYKVMEKLKIHKRNIMHGGTSVYIIIS